MRKSELIAELNKIEGDPNILVYNRDGYCELGHISECYTRTPEKLWDEITEVYQKGFSYEDADFDSSEEWEEFKSDPEHNVIVLWP